MHRSRTPPFSLSLSMQSFARKPRRHLEMQGSSSSTRGAESFVRWPTLTSPLWQESTGTEPRVGILPGPRLITPSRINFEQVKTQPTYELQSSNGCVPHIRTTFICLPTGHSPIVEWALVFMVQTSLPVSASPRSARSSPQKLPPYLLRPHLRLTFLSWFSRTQPALCQLYKPNRHRTRGFRELDDTHRQIPRTLGSPDIAVSPEIQMPTTLLDRGTTNLVTWMRSHYTM